MNSQDQEQIAQASQQQNSRTYILQTPIKRGDTEFKDVTINRPFGPALRGMSLAKLINEGDHDSFVALIPRITSPQISKIDIDSGALDSGDLIKIIGEITYFFIPKSERVKIDASQTE
jgi:hypothetical protein